jgi:hypothetical protein
MSASTCSARLSSILEIGYKALSDGRERPRMTIMPNGAVKNICLVVSSLLLVRCAPLKFTFAPPAAATSAATPAPESAAPVAAPLAPAPGAEAPTVGSGTPTAAIPGLAGPSQPTLQPAPGTSAGGPASAPALLEPRYSAIRAQVFVRSCLRCHAGGDDGLGRRSLSRVDAMIQQGYVIPGNPEASPLVQAISEGAMPPTRAQLPPVEAQELQAIREWIRAGAPAN